MFVRHLGKIFTRGDGYISKQLPFARFRPTLHLSNSKSFQYPKKERDGKNYTGVSLSFFLPRGGGCEREIAALEPEEAGGVIPTDDSKHDRR